MVSGSVPRMTCMGTCRLDLEMSDLRLRERSGALLLSTRDLPACVISTWGQGRSHTAHGRLMTEEHHDITEEHRNLVQK